MLEKDAYSVEKKVLKGAVESVCFEGAQWDDGMAALLVETSE